MRQRTDLLLSREGTDALKKATVLVCGTGGVGSFAAQALARTGIGKLVLIDKDVVEPSNINRQLPARIDTIGRKKVEILEEDFAKINPELETVCYACFYDQDMNDVIREEKPDFILDCIDSMKSKKDLIRFALDENIPIVSSMGMARKKNPSRLAVMEIEKTSYDPMAKELRTWKRKNRIKDRIMVVSSDEPPMSMEKGSVLPSAIFVPGSAGLMMASYAVNKIIEEAARKSENENS